MEEALVAYLLANGGVSSLVGNRIFWAALPQGMTLPAVTMHKISAPRSYTMGGSSGLIPARVQMDCWGSNYGAAKQVARALISALSGQTFTQSGVTISGAFVDDEDDSTEESAGGTRINRTRVDVILWHEGT